MVVKLLYRHPSAVIARLIKIRKLEYEQKINDAYYFYLAHRVGRQNPEPGDLRVFPVISLRKDNRP